LRVERDHHVTGKRGASLVQEARRLHGRGADDDVADAGVDKVLDSVEIADAAAELDRKLAADGFGNRPDPLLVFQPTGGGAVQIPDVQPPRAEVEPALRGRRRVVGEYSGLVHRALLQAHALAVLEVDRGNDQHGAMRPGKRPSVWRVARRAARRRNWRA